MENPGGQQPDNLRPEPEAGPQTISQWLAGNGFSLLVVACLLGLIFYHFDVDGQLAILKVALGLSFVIFIHELGHFLVAKWCDVHVTTFSIGFGPPLPGCAWQRGETTYKLSLIPLGGYVQMVGQVDGDEASDGSEDDPRSYRNKTVGQRMAIISAGVIMNVILAIICFIGVYEGPGKDRPAAVIGGVDTDAPAFRYGIRSGDEVLQIGATKNPTFEELMLRVMSSQGEERIPFDIKHPNGDVVHLDIEPRKRAKDTRPMIGVIPAEKLQLRERRLVDNTYQVPAAPDSSAAMATPGFKFGDQIVAMTDPDAPGQLDDFDPKRISELPNDPRAPSLGQKDYFAFAHRLQKLADKTIVIRVQREGEAQPVDITVAPAYRHSLGIRMQMGEVISIREKSPAHDKIHVPTTRRSGDKILAVSVVEPDGSTLTYRDEPKEGEKPLDPERLPYQLRQWAATRLAEEQRHADKAKNLSWDVTLSVRRHRDEAGRQFDDVEVRLPWDVNWRFDRAIPINMSSPLAIAELGLAYQVQTTIAWAEQNSPLKAGDVIKNIKFDVQGPKEVVKGSWQREDLDDTQWAQIAYELLQNPFPLVKVHLRVKRDQKTEDIEIAPTPDKSWALADRGWFLMQDTRKQKASNIFEAVAMGLHDTQSNMMQVFQNLRGMVTGRLSVKNLVGPLMIGRVAYRFASIDFSEFVFFLGLISVNLAVVNFLPVPVLDGGHMVFLIYEKLRGRPASEGVRVAATYAGLALILSLMLFVFWLDITRLFL